MAASSGGGDGRRVLLCAADSAAVWPRGADGDPLPALLARCGNAAALRAVYVGAANGDQPDFYEIFCALMQAAGLRHELLDFARLCSDVTADWEDARRALTAADVVLLSGGDPSEGMRRLRQRGRLDELLARRWHAGEVALAGISAGAMQFAQTVLQGGAAPCEGLCLVPRPAGIAALAMHEEADGWAEALSAAAALPGWAAPGGEAPAILGLPFGCACLIEADGSVRVLGQPAVLLRGGAAGEQLALGVRGPASPPAGAPGGGGAAAGAGLR
eukprot:TRINITY_DN31996_c0_g1_i1.p1 TRINITY_DN31996_c0_g1~~TRINITY_DN31996_c0_g1_i1.p1  ORF type:complete len:299 (+),score=87.49 TRINITY_DN31996_c0_g1_i1:79-897(+)